MTMEEMQQLIETQNRSIADLTAERDSLKTENDQLRDQEKTRSEELRKTKELNFTLARNISRETPSAEDILKDII